jgi:hypothetical protein
MSKLFLTKWKPIKTIWPYPEGYGIYRINILTGNRTLLDPGLTKTDAQESADQLNKIKDDLFHRKACRLCRS